jgi:hypothetical protein
MLLPVDGSLSGDVIRTGRHVVVNDASHDPRVAQPGVRLGVFGPTVFVPLSARGRTFGTVASATQSTWTMLAFVVVLLAVTVALNSK